ncbi:hypothetical protein ACMFMG_011825 [Clarireedia jacksonii]
MAARNPSYSEFIRLRSQINPCITGLAEYIKLAPRAASTIAMLEYLADGSSSGPIGITEIELQKLPKVASSISGRVIFIESISPVLISHLGQLLDVDPLFFAGYISTDLPDIEKAALPPSLALYPSQLAAQGYLHIHYQQVIGLGSAEQFKNSAYALKTDSNVPRNTRRLPHLSGQQLALTRGCCSILLKRLEDIWYTIILTDPPTKAIIETPDLGPPRTYPSIPLHSSFENFEQPASFSSFGLARDSSFESWDKSSMLTSLLHYFQNHPPGFAVVKPSILSLGYYPIKIVLAEWILYIHLVSRYLKYYEYSLHDIHNRLHSSDIVDLQRWRRRSKQSRHKLYLLSIFISHWLSGETEKQPWDMLLKDIDYISLQLKDYSHSIEQMVPVATSMIQLLDARQSVLQAANITRLTYIALVFVPLSWVTGLFSMSESYSPGQEQFWIYFATALPLLLVVLLASILPFNQLAVKIIIFLRCTLEKFRGKSLATKIDLEKNLVR